MVAENTRAKPLVITGIIASNEENEARPKGKSTGSRQKEFEILGLPEGADKDQF
jgi:hypothetical protein